jgi:hypothetical protein
VRLLLLQELPQNVYIALSHLFQFAKSLGPHRIPFLVVSFLVKAQHPKISAAIRYDLWIDEVESLIRQVIL